MKLKFFCVYLPPLSAKCALTVKNVVKMIKILFQSDHSFYDLWDFNTPNINWTTPSTDFNESHECFLNFWTDKFLTQVIEIPTHKNGNTLDLIIYFSINKHV